VLNFRYHVVSLVAVFLALGIGILIGAGALDRPTVEFLQDRIDTVEANADARRAENELLQSDVDRLESTLAALEPFSVTDRLTQTEVLVVAIRGVDPETMQGLVELARRAGAAAPGILWIEEAWALSEPDERDALAAALDVTEPGRAALRTLGWEGLVDRLHQGPGLGDSDLLTSLADAGFVSFEGVGGDTPFSEIGGTGTAALLVVGTEASVKAKHVLVPAAQAAVDADLPLAAAEMFVTTDGGAVRGALVSLVRGDETLSAEVATVDDLDLPAGSAVSLLALADQLRGVVGHYGVGEGATAPTPEWSQP
jgi:hypothetical protein